MKGAWLVVGVLCLGIAAAQQKDEEEEDLVFPPGRLLRILEAPSLHLYSGLGRSGREGMEERLRQPGVVALELGSADVRLRQHSLVSYKRAYVVVGVASSAMGAASAEGLEQQWWRVGFGSEEGYGYQLGERSALLLTHGGGLQWTYGSFRDSVPQLLEAFRNRLRFGVGRSGAAIVQFTPVLGVGISFERAVVFPAHLVWKHLGSAVLEGAGHALIEQFVGRILRARAPQAAPVVGFVLHNGFAVGWYELLRSRMNWPFHSAAPLRLDALRFHLQLLF